MARGDDVDLWVALPRAWALSYERVQVVFHASDVLGWRATLESVDGDPVLTFPWYDHVDKMFRGEVPSELPDPALPEGEWDDLEQGWWAAVRVVDDIVFIAETDLDSLLDVEGTPIARSIQPGRVDLSGTEVIWSCVPRAAWDEAWRAARASCVRKSPAPTRRGRAGGA